MGNACGGGAPKETTESQEITKYLKEEKKKLDAEVKLLLLGAGESGKSTIAKQMKIIHLSGFPENERLSYKSIIYNNIFVSMKALVGACEDLNIPIADESNKAIASRILDDPTYFTGVLNKQMAKEIGGLWNDPAVKKAYDRQSEFQLNDSAAYYLNELARIAEDDYIPTEQDVLRSRAKTTGIIETEFTIEKTKFRMVDVGGQRSERKKWMHCFQDVTCVIFCVALSEYDLTLYEDDTTNRMHESLKLFKEICNSKWFVETSMILFLNKKDLFEEKIKRVDLKMCFEEYQGGRDAEVAGKFIEEKFIAQNEQPKKHIYVHRTCATDTGNIMIVFNAVKDIILQEVLSNTGITI
jgi:GTPase SAR1 family protein